MPDCLRVPAAILAAAMFLAPSMVSVVVIAPAPGSQVAASAAPILA